MTIQPTLLVARPWTTTAIRRAVEATARAARARCLARHGEGMLVRPVRSPGEPPMLELRRGGKTVVRCARPVGRWGAFDLVAQLQAEARDWWALGSHREGCRGCGSTEVRPMRICAACEAREAQEDIELQGDLWT